MKKTIVLLMMIVVLIFSSCTNQALNQNVVKKEEHQRIIYQSENGPIEVPANPKRIVVLNSFVSGHVMALGGNIVGIDSWSKGNLRYQKYIKEAVEVSDESLEKIAELNPDLIIVAPTNKNIDKLSKIAPTVIYTYGKVDYLTQFLEVGKLMNKEKVAQEWINNFKSRAQKIGEELRAKIGENATITVIESFDKQLYVFGENWGRGTEILYKEMKLKMPQKVRETALKQGYYAISPEVLPEFVGDYIVFSKNSTADNSFQETQTYKNIPAVKYNRVIEVNASEFYFNDPITLEYQLELFKSKLLGN